LLVHTQPLVINPSIFAKLPIDVAKDFAPVSQLTAAPYLLVAHPSLPVKSVKELLALARSKPGALNYASGGIGTNLHIAIELLKNITGTKLTHVPYKGAGLALGSVVAGETMLAIPALGAALPQVNAGRLRALAISGAQRSAVIPQVPTIAEAGVPGYEFNAWVGVLAPASTPPVIISALNGFFVKALRAPEVSARLAADGNNVIAGSPAEFAALIKTDIVRWAKVVRENGIKSE
jgi:tripartite-type tricarboxylate transporter receptor subunit TctC